MLTGIRCGNRKYNDIRNWDWTVLFQAFGDADGTNSQTHTVSSKFELEELLGQDDFKKPGCIQLVEVVMDVMDAPWALQRYMKSIN